MSPYESWERYLELERRELERRKEGTLARALGFPLPGEDQEELARLAREDRLRAEEGLVDLKEGDRVWYKRLEDLTRQDRPARLEAETARLAWLRQRWESRPPYLRRETERDKLAKRAAGKMSRTLGQTLQGESSEELERIASEDQHKAQQGMVRLKSGARIYYKHIDDLTPEDHIARLEADRDMLTWLAGRRASQRAAALLASLLESGSGSSQARTPEDSSARHPGE
jgi:hypothetical protein